MAKKRETIKTNINTSIEGITYSDALNEVEEIISSLQGGNIDINQLQDKIKRGVALIAYCKEELKSSEDNINKLFE